MKTGRRIIMIFMVVSLLTGDVSLAAAAVIPQTALSDTIISPSYIEHAFPPGTGYEELLTVTTATPPVPMLDVLFVFDVTSSMSGVINAAKERGKEIMRTIDEQVRDAAFGVGSFSDYPGIFSSPGYRGQYGASSDYPWRLDAGITTDADAVQNAINRLSLHNGEDGPEDYTRALFETMLVNWRPGAKRVVVLFGDAPAHDMDFFSRNYGGDPGPDAEIGTADDLDFEEIVQAVANYPIQVVPINSDLRGNEDAARGFEYIARQTGGRVFSISEARLAPEAAISGLTEASTMVTRLMLVPSAEMPDWVSITPDFHPGIGGGVTKSFGISYDIPADAVPGIYEFTLTVSADGATLGVVPVKITITGLDLDPTELLDEKQALIDFLSAPSADIRILEVPILYTASKTYKPVEDQVQAFIDTILPASARPAEIGSLARLTILEDAAKTFWGYHVQASNIIGKHVGNIILVGLSFLKLLDFLNRPDIKPGMRGLVTKILNEIYKKVVDVLDDLVQAILSTFPNQESEDVQQWKTSFKLLFVFIKTQLDTGASLKEILIGGLVPAFVIDKTNDYYVGVTQDDLQYGLDNARTYAIQDLSQETVSTAVYTADNRVDSLVSAVSGEYASLEASAEKIEAAQGWAKVATDFADIASLLSASTGVGSVVSGLTQLLSMLIRLVDVLFSGAVIYQAGSLWVDLPPASERAAEEALPSASVREGEPEGYAESPRMAGSYGAIIPVALSLSPARANLAVVLASRAEVSASDFLAQLNQLEAAMRSGDSARVQQLVEPLLLADEALSGELRSGRAPALAAASNPELAANPAWNEAYSFMITSSSRYGLTGAIFYLHLYAYLLDPTNSATQAELLEATGELNRALDETLVGLERILPLAEPYVTMPLVSIANIRYPDAIEVGQPFDLAVELANPSPLPVGVVLVQLTPESGLTVVSSAELRVDSLPGYGTSEVTFQARLSEEVGVGGLIASAPGASGSQRIVYLHSSSRQSGGLGGIGIFALFMIGMVGLGGVYYARLRRRGGPKSGSGIAVRAASLSGRSGEFAGRIVSLTRDNLIIGRGTACTIRLNDRTVSRQHARLRFAQGQWFIQDLQSNSGTYVNGQRIQAHALRRGDRIRVGSSEFEFLG